MLRQLLHDKRLDVRFSRIMYRDIAPVVGLDPVYKLFGMETFELHRSRIPTDLLKNIIQDMDHMLLQYRSHPHSTEEATSRFLSPIFDRLVAEFSFSFRNIPENLIKGHITTKGRVAYYLSAFHPISVLVVEVKLKCPSIDERMDAIALVIAECDACHFNNSTENFSVPVFGILWDGSSFQFFKFEGTSQPFKFLCGTFPDYPLMFFNGIKLPDLRTDENALPFMQTVCLIKAFQDRPLAFSNKERVQKTLAKWEDALTFAKQALLHFRDAESKRQDGDKTGANNTVSHAQMLLKHSLDAVPLVDPEDFLLIPYWNDDDIELA